MDLSDWLGIAAIGLGAVPGLNDEQRKLALQGLQATRAIVQARKGQEDEDEKLHKGWVKFAKKLMKEKDLSDEARISWLKPKVKADLYLRDNVIPDGNTVTMLAESAVAVAKFD